jgi:K+-sensing histidine kinase KdpD
LFGKLKKCNDYNSTGVGLGLAYWKSVVCHLNGEIYSKSEQGKGAKFTLYINVESCDNGL